MEGFHLKPAAQEPIAVLGVGCRFSGANDRHEFWQLLSQRVEAIRGIPKGRWNHHTVSSSEAVKGKTYSCKGGFIVDGDAFDADLFGISESEARTLDPQQGAMLEISWQALEDAGIAPSSLANTLTGVYVGTSTSDFDRRLSSQFESLDVRAATGGSGAIVANRVSYVLSLCGPSLSVDVACASSLTAIHLACQSLRARECDLAIAGGVQLILSPANLIAFSQGAVLARDGRTKTFSQFADGYVCGEGVGALVLKRLDEAERDRHRVLAIIAGSAVNHNGLSNGLTAPSARAQKLLIRTALNAAGIAPADIGYVETHGGGTVLGDAIELNALQSLLSEGRAPGCRCFVGSVKPNVGHLEAAAGMPAIIKAILALEHEEIPACLHSEPLNEHLRLVDSQFVVPTTAQPWPRSNRPRAAGVSAFGFGGGNAHIVVRESHSGAATLRASSVSWPLVVSAQSPSALRMLVQSHLARLENPAAPIRDSWIPSACYTAAVGRDRLKHRVAFVIDSCATLILLIRQYLSSEYSPRIIVGEATKRDVGQIAMTYEQPQIGARLNGLPEEWASVLASHTESARRHLSDLNDPSRSDESVASLLAMTSLLAIFGLWPKFVAGSDPCGAHVARILATTDWQIEDSTHQRPTRLNSLDLQSMSRFDTEPNTSVQPPPGDRLSHFNIVNVSMSNCFAAVLAQADVAGVGVDWSAFFGPVHCNRETLPTYPFERRRHWEIPNETHYAFTPEVS